MPLQIVTLDFETYFDDDYSLSKMTTEAYVRDARFEVHGCGVGFIVDNTMHTRWLTGYRVHQELRKLDWSVIAVLAHHAHFDGLILSHHYGIKPKFWFDTLSMARLWLDSRTPKSLDSLSKHYGLGSKGMPYNLFKGLRWGAIPPAIQEQMMAETQADCVRTYKIFQRLAEHFPRSEYELIDMTVRMFTEPKLVGDRELFQGIVAEEREKKEKQLELIGATATEVGSNARFTELLEEAGIEVEYKAGKAHPDGTPKLIPAFAKNDEFMRELLLDEDPYVVALAEARIGTKSTTLETRAATYDAMASRGALPIYLNYCGAHTTRWSGGDDQNSQNLKRRHRIRKGLRAPPGYRFGAPDASQIECRLLNYLAGQLDVVEMFRTGQDVYCHTASAVYGREITKADEAERGTGKQCELSCGYGAGWRTFKRTAALGAYGPPMKLTEAQARHAVDTYRATHQAVTQLWRHAENVILPHLVSGTETQWGPTTIAEKCIWLPNGAPLIYEGLTWREGEWLLLRRSGYTKMYGGKLVENWIQALARTHTAECMKIINHKFPVVGMAHDDTWVLIPDDEASKEALDWCVSVIATPPSWAPDCPLAAEGKMGDSYA